MSLIQALHCNWLPRITAEVLASLGRCPHGAVSPDRKVLQKTTFVREEPYLTFVKVELEVVGSHPAEHIRDGGAKSKVGCLLSWIQRKFGDSGVKKEKQGAFVRPQRNTMGEH